MTSGWSDVRTVRNLLQTIATDSIIMTNHLLLVKSSLEPFMTPSVIMTN